MELAKKAKRNDEGGKEGRKNASEKLRTDRAHAERGRRKKDKVTNS